MRGGIPAVADFVPGYETSDWCGLVMPMNTPADIISKLNKEINAALASPVTRVAMPAADVDRPAALASRAATISLSRNSAAVWRLSAVIAGWPPASFPVEPTLAATTGVDRRRPRVLAGIPA
jgi:hypothetical protein